MSRRPNRGRGGLVALVVAPVVAVATVACAAAVAAQTPKRDYMRPPGFNAFAARVRAAGTEAGTAAESVDGLVREAPWHGVRLLLAELRVVSTKGERVEHALRVARALERALSRTGRTGVDGLVDRVAGYDDGKRARLEQTRRRMADATTALRSGRIREAIGHARDAARIYRTLGRPFLAADAETTLGEALVRAGRFQGALKVLAPLLKRMETLASPLVQSKVHRLCGFACDGAGRVDAADRHLLRAERLLDGIDAPLRVAMAKEVRGAACVRRGRVLEGIELLREARALVVRCTGPDSTRAAIVGMQLGHATAESGEFVAAIELIEPAARVLGARGLRSGAAAARHNLGILYGLVGRRREARATLVAARGAFTALKDARRAAQVSVSLAWLCSRTRDFTAAHEHVEAAREALRRSDPRSRIHWLTAKGRCLMGKNRAEEAGPYFERALGLATKLGLKSTCIALRVNAAVRAYRLERLDEALALLDRAGADMGAPSGFRGARWCDRRGLVLHAMGKHEAALDAFEQASRLYEASRLPLARFGDAARLDQTRASDAWVPPMAAAAAFDAGPAFAPRAFSILERRTGTAMRDLLTEAAIRPEPRGDEAARSKRRALARRLAVARRARRGGDETSGAALRALDREWAALEEAARARDARYGAIAYPRGLDAAAVQRGLAPGEVLVSFLVAKKRAFAFVVRSDGVRLRALGATDAVMRPVEMLIEAMRAARPAEGWAPIAARVSASLLHPIESDLEGATFLTIIPHGRFCFVPYDVLALADGTRVVARWPIRLGHSATALAALAALARAPRDRAGAAGDGAWMLAFGDPVLDPSANRPPLPGARAELARIAARLEDETTAAADAPKRTVAFVGEAATEAAFVASVDAGHYGAVHLACHGVADAEHPMLSGLWLAPSGPSGDGFLSVREILALRLDADVVVLSACDGNVGPVERLEGVQSLTRAFLHAGAQSVVVSNWRVSDRTTPELMAAFHGAWLRDGHDPMEALRRAKHALHARGVHPAYWAGFALWGIGRAAR